ncbi:Histone-lysine N-methyltransferase SETMAR [Eumeta japonica]|uniref:Histone-lysine N-methyltransferase SETMAR n=1 Tax=Eumeta variegata TaxID=151549 RepID=A0A4C1WRG6_EUMVA|nr:Histone-lysine N-methyltransferase SETMAR [Eumeta japonica]
MAGQKIELAGHTPYSPDLTPNDFYLFPSVKNKLRGQRFLSRKEAVDSFKIPVLEIPQSEWKRLCAAAVSLLLRRMDRWNGRENSCSVLSLGRSAQAECNNKSRFFVRAAAFIDL